MAKSPINKNYKVTIKGILSIEDEVVNVEVVETGELVSLSDLLKDFNSKDISISCTYSEDCGTIETE